MKVPRTRPMLRTGTGTTIGADMIWYICFFLTLLLFAAALRVALRRAYG